MVDELLDYDPDDWSGYNEWLDDEEEDEDDFGIYNEFN